MRILVLNGSPRPNGNTKHMIDAFSEGAVSAGHQVEIIDVCKKKIGGCLACEYCHSKGHGECIQKDDMQQVYSLLKEVAIILSSGAAHQYDGALFSYQGDFLEYLGLENMGVFTVPGSVSSKKLEELRKAGASLK
ncbi:MAG: flavodoxin family protein [Clostridia bacterium]|nr:flavodoxin family protein [Lachnospiraceae bacterium]NCC01152.1 flavodoxin family protein [Clostridia bacterium]NCD03050.1 flavodoxin family protein [Clostridia bacterium]